MLPAIPDIIVNYFGDREWFRFNTIQYKVRPWHWLYIRESVRIVDIPDRVLRIPARITELRVWRCKCERIDFQCMYNIREFTAELCNNLKTLPLMPNITKLMLYNMPILQTAYPWEIGVLSVSDTEIRNCPALSPQSYSVYTSGFGRPSAQFLHDAMSAHYDAYMATDAAVSRCQRWIRRRRQQRHVAAHRDAMARVMEELRCLPGGADYQAAIERCYASNNL